jgi:hypothetical protein
MSTRVKTIHSFAGWQAHIAERTRIDASAIANKEMQLEQQRSDESAYEFRQHLDFERRAATRAANRQAQALRIGAAQVKEAQKTLETETMSFRMSQRSFVTAKSAFVEPGKDLHIGLDGRVTLYKPGNFHVVVGSSGATPSRNVKVTLHCLAGNWKELARTPENTGMIPGTTLPAVAVLSPNSSMDAECELGDWSVYRRSVSLPEPQLELLAGSMLVKGTITYTDIFGGEHESAEGLPD